MSKEEGLPFALIRWIKRNQEEIEAHRVVMVARNARDDQKYMGFIREIAPSWPVLKLYERTLITNLVQWKEDGKNFTTQQKSAINGMYLRRVLDPKTK